VEDAAGAPSPLHALAAWSIVHGAALLYLDGPVRTRLPPDRPRAAFEEAMEAILGGALVEKEARRGGARPKRR